MAIYFEVFLETLHGKKDVQIRLSILGVALHIFRVRGRAIGKGICFPDVDIKNGIDFTMSVQGTVPICKI